MKTKLTNTARLSSAISEAEGQSHTRTITPQDIANTIANVDSYLQIPRIAMDGIYVYADPNAGDIPESYRYPPDSTQFIATFRHDDNEWYVTAIYRGPCRPPKSAVHIALTAAAKEAVLKRASVMSICTTEDNK